MLLGLYTDPQPGEGGGGTWCNAPTTNLDAPTSNLQNTKPKHADQHTTEPATWYRIHSWLCWTAVVGQNWYSEMCV